MDTLTELQSRALDIVRRHTRDNPIIGKHIANAIGMVARDTGKEGADLRAVVNALRRHGWPVCATGDGYWYPRDRAELSEYIASLDGRIAKTQEAADGMRRGFDKVGVTRELPPAMPGDVVARYASASRANVHHTVREPQTGKFVCDCESYSFSTDAPKSCKHIVRLLTERSQGNLI